MNKYTLTQNQTKQMIELHLKANIPLLITSVGGAGKSALVQQVADECNLHLIDLRLSQLVRYDLLGYPQATSDGKMEFFPIAEIPLETDPIPNGKDGWILFLNTSGLH